MAYLPRRGDFNGRTLVGEHQPDPMEMVADTSFFGLTNMLTCIYATVRDRDGEIYTAVRNGEPKEGAPRHLMLMTTLGGNDCLRFHRAGKLSARSSGWQRTRSDEELRLDSAPAEQGRPFHAVFRPTSFEYEEEGTLELSGPLVGPGLHWALLGRERGIYYVSQIYEVEGHVFDQPVRGFAAWDDVYLPKGGTLYVDDPLITEKVEISWCTWGTRYKDGTLEVGHFAFGHGHYGFGLINNQDGLLLATSDVDGVVTPSDDVNFPKRVEYVVAGERWEFVPDPRGACRDLMPWPNPQFEGQMRRVGERREREVWWAFGETAPAHGLSRKPWPGA